MKGMIFLSQSDDMSVVTSHGPSFPQFPFLVAFKQAVNPPHTLEILEMYHSICGCGDLDNPSRNNYTSQHLVKLHCNARRCLTASRFVCCLWVAGQGGHKWGGRRRIRRFSSSFTLTVYCWGSVVLAFCCETP